MVCDASRSLKSQQTDPFHCSLHLRWNIPKASNIAYGALSNILENWLPITEYLSYSLSDFQMVCIKRLSIIRHVIFDSQLHFSMCHSTMKIRGEYRNLTSHPEKETGHAAANFEEIPAMVRDASGILKITAI